MSHKLKQCPFCGGKAKVVWDKFYEARDCGGERQPAFDEWEVKCTICNFSRDHFPTEKLAVQAWNTRPRPDDKAGKDVEKEGR